uniref:Uncharacterized protein n=1 Tax=Ditylenchus dipsaci TaxID=166011 RepID=A0A915ETI5_9BILA
MISQFNKHHGAKEVSFALGAPVYFRIYQGNKIGWAPSSISQKFGQRIYEVQAFDGKFHRRHANQFRPPPCIFHALLLLHLRRPYPPTTL